MKLQIQVKEIALLKGYVHDIVQLGNFFCKFLVNSAG